MQSMSGHCSSGESKADKEQQVLSALRGINYGSIEVIIHDSEIVQIIRTEKQRLEKSPSSE